VRSEYVAGSRFHYHARVLPHTFLLFLGVLLLATAPFVRRRGEIYVHLGVGAAALLIGAWWLRRSWKCLTWRVAVHADGLFSNDECRTTTCRWDDVAEVWEDVTRHVLNNKPLYRTHRFTLRLRDGRMLVLDDRLQGIDALADAIRAEVYPRLLQRAREQWKRGEALAFGPVRLERVGVWQGAELLPWGELSDAAVERGVLEMRRGERCWRRLTVARTPNYAVFLTLVRQEIEVRRGAPSP
jgi:hypothetical protein